jgi:predicted NAD/FAD-dependent oxidoreductase
VSNGLSIVGGGISGLSTALKAIESGKIDPASVHIYEKSGRAGGQIRTAKLDDGTLVNMGAEFIDSDSPLLSLCEKLGVKTIKSDDQSTYDFQRRNGARFPSEEFFPAYAPLAARIAQDKAEALKNPEGEAAKRLDNMSLEEYIKQAASETKANPDRSWWEFTKDLFSFNWDRINNRIPEDVVHAVTQAYTAEACQPASNISALQFLREVSDKPGMFLASDCKYRVEGGTEQLVVAMREHLQHAGVKFHTNSEVGEVSRTGKGYQLNFKNGDEIATDKVVMALPAYALTEVKGIEALGIDRTTLDTLRNAQYTNAVKFTVKLQKDIQMGRDLPDTSFFSSKGFQCWSSEPGTMTFLVTPSMVGSNPNSKEIISYCLSNYTSAVSPDHSADDLFNTSRGNIAYSNPGKTPCYGSPKKGQSQQMYALRESLQQLAPGAGIVGTFVPSEHGSIGFMECGLESATRTADIILAPSQARSQALEAALARGPMIAQAQDSGNLSLPPANRGGWQR